MHKIICPICQRADRAHRRLLIAMAIIIVAAGCSHKLTQAEKAEHAAPREQVGKEVHRG